MPPILPLRLLLIVVFFHFDVFFVGNAFAQSTEDYAYQVDKLLKQAQAFIPSDSTESLSNKALSLARTANYQDGWIRALSLLGENASRQDRPDEALRYYLEALTKSEKTANSALKKSLFAGLGTLFYKEKLYPSAIEYFNRVIAIDGSDFETLEILGDSWLADMQYDSAEVKYKKLISVYNQQNNYVKVVGIYQKLVHAYNEEGNYGKGVYYYQLIADIIERKGTLEEKGILYNNLGRQYMLDRNFAKALENFRKSELQCQYANCASREVMLTNLGICLHNTGNTPEGIRYLLQAEKLLQQKSDNSKELAALEQLITGTYFNSNDIYNSLTHNQLAIKYAKDSKSNDLLATAYETQANIYFELYDFERAYTFYQLYLNLMDGIRVENAVRLQRLTQQQFLLERSEKEVRTLLFQQEIKDLALQQANLEREKLAADNKTLALEAQSQQDKLLQLASKQSLADAELRLKSLEALKAQQELRLAAQRLDTEKKDREIQDLHRKEEIETQRQAAEDARQRQEVALLQRDKEISQLQLSQEASFRKFAYGLGALLLVILGLMAAGFLFSRRTNAKLNQQNKAIEAQKAVIQTERERSDKLLLNILPEELASELKAQGEAKPRSYEEVTVLFTDFVNFTSLTSHLQPHELLAELDTCFVAFDDICDRHNLEKIKTIGDAFMCAGGVPVTNTTNAINAVAAALEMMEFLINRKAHNPNALLTRMRIGLHTGPVVAGLVGKNKFAYDIWGDAVNLAARMEEYSEPGKINISVATYQKVKENYACTPRGEIEVHNKGLVQMYFVDKMK